MSLKDLELARELGLNLSELLRDAVRQKAIAKTQAEHGDCPETNSEAGPVVLAPI